MVVSRAMHIPVGLHRGKFRIFASADFSLHDDAIL